jgi:hypothetical protein
MMLTPPPIRPVAPEGKVAERRLKVSRAIAGVAAVAPAIVRAAPRVKVHVIATPPCGTQFGFRVDVWQKANKALASLEGFETHDVDAGLTAPTGAPRYNEDAIHQRCGLSPPDR